MAYDEDLADRIREIVVDEVDLTERKMFGGLAFLIGGNMSVAVSGEGGLLVRVDPDQCDALLSEPGTSPLVMRGRPMNGWLRVTGEVVEAAEPLARWVARGIAYARLLPPKASSGRGQNVRSFSDVP